MDSPLNVDGEPYTKADFEKWTARSTESDLDAWCKRISEDIRKYLTLVNAKGASAPGKLTLTLKIAEAARMHGVLEDFNAIVQPESKMLELSTTEIRQRMASGVSDSTTEFLGASYATVFSILDKSDRETVSKIFGDDENQPLQMELERRFDVDVDGKLFLRSIEVSIFSNGSSFSFLPDEN